jgi:hypothetical protein
LEFPDPKAKLITLKELLEHLFNEETLDDFLCPKCHCQGTEKSLFLAQLPEFITFNLSRAQQLDDSQAYRAGIQTRVPTEDILDLRDFLHPSQSDTVAETVYELQGVSRFIAAGPQHIAFRKIDGQWVCLMIRIPESLEAHHY